MRIKKFLLALLVIFNLIFTWVIFGPTEIFFANYIEFGFIYSDFGVKFILAGVLLSFVGALIISLLPQTVYKGVMAIVAGVSLAAYIQNLFLNRDLDLIGATAEGYQPEAGKVIVNAVIWCLILAGMFLVAYKKKVNEKKVFGMLAGFLLAVQLVAFGSLFLTADKTAFEYPEGELCLDMEEQFTFSSNENIIMLMFDNVSNVWLDEARLAYPDIFDSVKDFTYFTNADCNYYGTFPSVVHTLTGNPVDFTLSVNEYMQECWDNPYTNAYYDTLAEHDYKVNAFIYQKEIIAAGNSLEITNGKLANVVESNARKAIDYPLLYQTLLQMSCYRYMPDGIKQAFNVNSEQYARIISYPENTIAYSNVDFYHSLLENGIELNDESNYVVFNHLSGCHEFINDENCERVKDVSRDQAIRGLFTLVEEYLEQLKAAGIYDNSTIIIMTDHGVMYNGQPMFLMKRRNESHDVIQESTAPITYEDIIPTLIDEIGGDGSEFGRNIYSYAEDEVRERIFYDRELNYDFPMVEQYTGLKQGGANIWKKYVYTGNRETFAEVYDAYWYEAIPMVDCYY